MSLRVVSQTSFAIDQADPTTPPIEPGPKPQPSGPEDHHQVSTHPGAARPTADTAENASRTVARLLSTEVARLDFVVTAGEARQSLETLAALSPSEFSLVAERLSAEGHLSTLLDHLDEEGRFRFLSLAADHGYLERLPGEAQRGRFEPPTAPTLYHQSVRLPRDVNDAIHQHSLAAVADYARRYDDYLDRYGAAVAGCRSGQELRALGSPHAPSSTWELTDLRDPEATRYAADWLRQHTPDAFRANQAVSDKLTELLGERKPGSICVEARAEGHFAMLGLEANLDSRNPARWLDAKGALVAPVPASDNLKLKTDGTLTGSVKLPGQRWGVSAEEKGGELRKGGVSTPWGSATSDGRRVTVTARGAYAWSNGEQVGAGLAAGATLGAGVAELKVSGGIGVQLLSSADAKHALSGRREGVFDVPAELKAGLGWEALPEAAREFHQRNGWTAEEWSAALSTASPHSLR